MCYTSDLEKQFKENEENVHEKSDFVASRLFCLLIFLALSSELMRKLKEKVMQGYLSPRDRCRNHMAITTILSNDGIHFSLALSFFPQTSRANNVSLKMKLSISLKRDLRFEEKGTNMPRCIGKEINHLPSIFWKIQLYYSGFSRETIYIYV